MDLTATIPLGDALLIIAGAALAALAVAALVVGLLLAIDRGPMKMLAYVIGYGYDRIVDALPEPKSRPARYALADDTRIPLVEVVAQAERDAHD